METKTYSIHDLHFEHRLWKSETKIVIGELNIYLEWLSCMSQKSYDLEFQKKIDSFQNKFDIQRIHFDRFNDRINAQDSYIESLERELGNEIATKTLTDHTNLRADITLAVTIYKELKEEYKNFCKSVKF
jgi:hypothetical protein